jgi:hypothetical protein
MYKGSTITEINSLHWQIQDKLSMIQKEIENILSEHSTELVSNTTHLSQSYSKLLHLKSQIQILTSLSKR